MVNPNDELNSVIRISPEYEIDVFVHNRSFIRSKLPLTFHIYSDYCNQQCCLYKLILVILATRLLRQIALQFPLLLDDKWFAYRRRLYKAMQSDSRPPPREAITAKASAVAPYNWINPGDLSSVLFVLKFVLFFFFTRLNDNYYRQRTLSQTRQPPVKNVSHFLILVGHGLYPA